VIGGMTTAIQGFVDSLLEEAAGEELYDHRWLAGDLALRVMSHIIGSPQVDRQLLRELADARGRYMGTHQEHLVHEQYVACRQFDDYVREVVLAEHRRNPGSNPLVTALLAAEGEERLSTEEVVALIVNMIIGGLETTAILFTNGVVELMRTRDQWQLLCEDPALVPSAVEELLRYVSPAQWTQRIAKQDLELHGLHIPGETTIVLLLAAANRDPRAYDDPDRLDVTRNPQHLDLGFGSHFCLGASLIRQEARILFTTLAQRYPDLELACDPGELDWSGSNPVMRIPATLPVSLGRRQPSRWMTGN
jgi:cytochrome P450